MEIYKQGGGVKVLFCLPAHHSMCSSLNLTPHQDTPTPHTVCRLLSVIRCNPIGCYLLLFNKGHKLIITTPNAGFALQLFTLFDLFQNPYFTLYSPRFSAGACSRCAHTQAPLLYILFIRVLFPERDEIPFQEACPHQTQFILSFLYSLQLFFSPSSLRVISKTPLIAKYIGFAPHNVVSEA